MAYTAQPTLADVARAKFEAVVHFLADAFEVYADAVSRKNEVSFLNSLTDAELAERGLTRDRIVHHVFRDKLGM